MTAKRKPAIPPTLIAKLAGIVVHADEWTSPGAHPFDRDALRSLLTDQEIIEWLKSVGPLAPQKRPR